MVLSGKIERPCCAYIGFFSEKWTSLIVLQIIQTFAPDQKEIIRVVQDTVPSRTNLLKANGLVQFCTLQSISQTFALDQRLAYSTCVITTLPLSNYLNQILA